MLIWKSTMEEMKEDVIQVTTLSEALQLEVDTLKQEEEEDQQVAVLPKNAKAKLMVSVTNQVGKAWEIALSPTWKIQETLLENSTSSQVLALPALKAFTLVAHADKANQMTQDPLSTATYANKETQISLEDNQEQR